MTTSKPRGLSVWELELLEHVTEHGQREGELLGAYRRLGDASGAEWVQYITSVIADEEIRHHQFFDDLANALRAPVERHVGESVPLVTRVEDPAPLIEATERLLDAEKRDAQELKRLSRNIDSMRGLSLWPVLVEIMVRDTEKHIAILEFVRTQLRDQSKRRR